MNTLPKFIESISINDIEISEFNPRKTINQDHIDSIAASIKEYGFDPTCALKTYKDGNKYKVFGGGTRYRAALKANIKELPIYLYEDLTEGEIWAAAYRDNEQAGQHNKVSIVDTWLDYAEKYLPIEDGGVFGYTQQQLADGLGVSQKDVSRRLTFSEFSKSVLKTFIQNDFLKEGHAEELSKLYNLYKTLENGEIIHPLDSWLNRDDAMVEILSSVLNKTKSPTAKNFKDTVDNYNVILKEVYDKYGELSTPYNSLFIKLLKGDANNKSARDQARIQSVYNTVLKQKKYDDEQKELEAQRLLDEAMAQAYETRLQAARQELIDLKMKHIAMGDARELVSYLPFDVSLLLTDPPYGIDFQSNRRKSSNKLDKLEGDDNISDALGLFVDVIQKMYQHMKSDSTILVWSGWRYEPEFRQAIKECGFIIKGIIIWDKPNHGTGDLEGSFSPKHECIIHAVKGNPKLNPPRLDDVLQGKEFLGSNHPTEKPIDLLKKLILATTIENDIVVDPFAGSGGVIMSAFDTGRDYYGIELNEEYFSFMSNELYKRIQSKEIEIEDASNE